MAKLSFIERQNLERLFVMEGGYVLDFNNRTFAEFIKAYADIDINAKIYCKRGSSKANCLRGFWDVGGDYVVGKIIGAMIEYRQTKDCFPTEDHLVEECIKISERLLLAKPTTDLDVLSVYMNETDFETIVQQLREAIERNTPEIALDRLHTFLIKYCRTLFEIRGVIVERDKPLHSIFGEYVKHLQNDSHIESEMTLRIMKSTISVLDAFNDVRNNKSLAHDNVILNREESLLIFNHVVSLIRFIMALELQIKNKCQLTVTDEEDILF